MISDLLTAVILSLTVFLVVYPASRAAWQSWQSWQRRQPGHDEAVPRR